MLSRHGWYDETLYCFGSNMPLFPHFFGVVHCRIHIATWTKMSSFSYFFIRFQFVSRTVQVSSLQEMYTTWMRQPDSDMTRLFLRICEYPRTQYIEILFGFVSANLIYFASCRFWCAPGNLNSRQKKSNQSGAAQTKPEEFPGNGRGLGSTLLTPERMIDTHWNRTENLGQSALTPIFSPKQWQ